MSRKKKWRETTYEIRECPRGHWAEHKVYQESTLRMAYKCICGLITKALIGERPKERK